MKTGYVVEYIDNQKIICGVVLEIRGNRLIILTEDNREVNHPENRLSHQSEYMLDLSIGKENLVEAIRKIALKRAQIVKQINVKDLWEKYKGKQAWIGIEEIAGLCFPGEKSDNHESAVVRAFFNDRHYFKFKVDRFQPFTMARIERNIEQKKAAKRKRTLIETAICWMQQTIKKQPSEFSEDKLEIINILKSYYLFAKDSPHYQSGKAILNGTGLGADNTDAVFKFLVKLGVWGEHENTLLLSYEIPTVFSDDVIACAEGFDETALLAKDDTRRDLTHLSLITIDGQGTQDFDDAVSLEVFDDHYKVGIHIADVGHFVKKGDAIDRAAMARGSSIYMPDQRIPMIPPVLAENYCSLREGELRPAISIMVHMDKNAEVGDYEIFPSWIMVDNQLTYYAANNMVDTNREIRVLHDIAGKLREKRLSNGAVQINLPEINIWIDENNTPCVNRVNRESPGRMLISEHMIMANWLMAKFLSEKDMPAIFRSQPEPKERLYKKDTGTFYQNLMQRKLLCRFVLGTKAESHSGLGHDAYLTATSPIRKYMDLVTQRQIRAVLGLEEPYTEDEIIRISQALEQPLGKLMRIQTKRNRYWLLSYLEGCIGAKEEAIVLRKQRDYYQVMLTEYMLECKLHVSSGITLKPESILRVTVQHVDARRDLLSVFL
ncbi:MAG: RNB domain-containing ribonuclease [Desulfobacterales bacterium]|nr:RNB domain-containing ribonuclease [Desulfobacterales bacterium]